MNWDLVAVVAGWVAAVAAMLAVSAVRIFLPRPPDVDTPDHRADQGTTC